MIREDVITHLKALAAGEVQPAKRRFGLCVELGETCNLSMPVVVVGWAAESWEHFSGNGRFPVPDPSYKDGLIYGMPVVAYCNTPEESMWSPDHPYGALRLDLCRHVAEYLESNPEIELRFKP